MISMMPVSEILYILEHLILKDHTGIRLEGWMNSRNSKNRYHKQLRNFSKVCTPKHYIQILTIKFKTDSIKSICRPMDGTEPLEVGHTRRWWYRSRRSCPLYSRNHMRSKSASNQEAIWGVSVRLRSFFYVVSHQPVNITDDNICGSQ